MSLLAAALLACASPVFAQATGTNPPPLPAEVDLNLINLPTTLSLQRHRGYFRLTHRFARDLRRGTFSDLASSLFSLDDGAVIGLEYRFAITGAIHAGATRSMLSKTIQTFVRWDGVRQAESRPVSVSAMVSYEGLNNLRDHHQPGVAVTVSRTMGDRIAVYATPAFVQNTQAVDTIAGHPDHDSTWLAGLGTRVRFSRSGYLVAEFTPRLAGYDPNRGVWGVGLEKRTGGHTLQLNITNSFGTTLGQLARGGSAHDVYLGFNITRKF